MSILSFIKQIFAYFSFFFFGFPLLGVFHYRSKVLYRVDKYAVAIIPAHNEERVIANIIKDCKMAGFNEIYVIADACTDKTVEIAGSLNVRVFQCDYHSKSLALTFVIPQIVSGLPANTAVYFFDADNRFHKSLLERSLPYLEFYNVIQFHLTNLNTSSFVSRMYLIMMASWHMFQQALMNLHISNVLGGTGWACNIDVLKDYPFNFHSVIDDVEYSMVVPYRVVYLRSIIVYDEKPNSLKVASKQLVRWTRGSFQLLFSDWRRFSFLKLWILYFPVLNLYNTFLLLLTLLSKPYFFLVTFVYGILLTVIQFGIYLIASGDIKRVSILDLLLFTPFSFLFIGIIIYSLFTFKNKRWVHTVHQGGSL
jgi:cellulose synthase/poly-beta-1,6-N-acetylglucosamine synthase-like glycosyltransferase